MSERNKPPAKPGQPPDEPGRLERDDRGNVTWQWSEQDTDLTADDTFGAAQRIRALVDPSLKIKEDEPDPLSPIQVNHKGLKQGYNPYNSGALGKQSWKKKKDLRKLSEWIELKKKIDGGKPDEG
ncbi:MAG TPA: hypothetical protein VNS57_05095 [Steroidobacteraceae bacterium]|nr:hypothetical protein [Steroidobacteraceae bacterium]